MTGESKLEELRRDIGDDLFSSLSDEDKEFILNTEGSVDLGFEATKEDINKICRKTKWRIFISS